MKLPSTTITIGLCAQNSSRRVGWDFGDLFC